jgi:hypothetical protein
MVPKLEVRRVEEQRAKLAHAASSLIDESAQRSGKEGSRVAAELKPREAQVCLRRSGTRMEDIVVLQAVSGQSHHLAGQPFSLARQSSYASQSSKPVIVMPVPC